MKIVDGKITCTSCNFKGAKFVTSDFSSTTLECTNCNRQVKCDSLKVGEALFDREMMEGHSLNYDEVEK